MADFFTLLWGSVVYRPYVYGFLIAYLFFSIYQLGWRKSFSFLVAMYFLAFLAEYSSTRNGFPFGIYTYIDTTRTRELWVSNVPFWDSLSFVFLSYFSFLIAAWMRGIRATETPLIGGLLMMLLDVVIDPVALRGEHWFLGKMYFYPDGGIYFGVTIANFIGWFLVGAFSQWIFQRLWRPERPRDERFFYGAYAIYAAVFGFNLFMTAWIGEYQLFSVSLLVALTTLFGVFLQVRRKTVFELKMSEVSS
jgi:putative membrane protein